MIASTVSGARTSKAKAAKPAAPVVQWDRVAGRVRLATSSIGHAMPVQRKSETNDEYLARITKREDAILSSAEKAATSLADYGAPAEVSEAARIALLAGRDVVTVTVGGVTVSASSKLGKALLAARRGLNPRGE